MADLTNLMGLYSGGRLIFAIFIGLHNGGGGGGGGAKAGKRGGGRNNEILWYIKIIFISRWRFTTQENIFYLIFIQRRNIKMVYKNHQLIQFD